MKGRNKVWDSDADFKLIAKKSIRSVLKYRSDEYDRSEKIDRCESIFYSFFDDQSHKWHFAINKHQQPWNEEILFLRPRKLDLKLTLYIVFSHIANGFTKRKPPYIPILQAFFDLQTITNYIQHWRSFFSSIDLITFYLIVQAQNIY